MSLTLFEMPEVKVMCYVWKLLPHVFCYRGVSVSYHTAYGESTSKEVCHTVLEAKILHGWTAACNIPLK